MADPDSMDYLSTLSAPELLAVSGRAEQMLRDRGVLRTRNRPAGDYAEYLIWKEFGGNLAPNSQRDWDVKTDDGERIQVKGCALPVGSPPSSADFSAMRGFDFDLLILVVFREPNYLVEEAWRAPIGIVRQAAKHSDYLNASHVRLTKQFRAIEGVESIAEQLRATAERLVRDGPTGDAAVPRG